MTICTNDSQICTKEIDGVMCITFECMGEANCDMFEGGKRVMPDMEYCPFKKEVVQDVQ